MKNLEEYMERVRNIGSQVEAVRVLGEIYSFDSSSGENTFSVNVKINDNNRLSGWDLFYEMVAAEKKYMPVTSRTVDKEGKEIEFRDYSASAYLATYLTIPKTRQNFEKKKNLRTKTCPEYSDHLTDVYLHIRSSVIPRWNPEKNDNFFAMLRSELLTVVNETAALEIPEYWQKVEKNGACSYSGTSLDSYIEGDGECQRDIADETKNVEVSALRKIEIEEASELRRLIIRNPEELFSKENIEAAITVNKLFGGLGDMASEILEEMEKEALVR